MLPIVEFGLEEGIAHEEAVQLINSQVEKGALSTTGRKDKWQEELSDQYQTLKLDNEPEADEAHFDLDQELGHYYSATGGVDGQQGSTGDPFTLSTDRVRSTDSGPVGAGPTGSQKILASRSVLKGLKRSEVLIAERPAPLGYSYYRNLVPDMNISMCSTCFRFFLEDYEIVALLEGSCPFCRTEREQRMKK